MSTYLGWNVVTLPALTTAVGTSVVPASIEPLVSQRVSASTNTFTDQQQTYNWGVGACELSVSMGAMTLAQGQAFAAFFKSCNGTSCVFQMWASLCAIFPAELTTDGSTPRYWRLKTNKPHWTIKEGKIYGVTFEVREAL